MLLHTDSSNANIDAIPQRPLIRSYTLRQGHLSQAQRRGIQRLYPKYGLPYQNQIIDLATVFQRTAPFIIEIGFGMGDATVQIAQTRTTDNFLGIEVHSPGVGSLLNKIEATNTTNIRIIQHDAVEVLQSMIAPNSVAGVHIFFPDPWPKARHHKRRLIQPTFVKLISSRLQLGGYVHCATDWENYAQQMLEVFNAEPQLQNMCTGYAPRPDYRPLTKFEQRGLRLGHGVWDLIFTRIANSFGNN